MFCKSFPNKKWSKTMNRRKKDMLSLDQMRKSDAIETLNLNTTVELSFESSIQSSVETSEFLEDLKVCQSKEKVEF